VLTAADAWSTNTHNRYHRIDLQIRTMQTSLTARQSLPELAGRAAKGLGGIANACQYGSALLPPLRFSVWQVVSNEQKLPEIRVLRLLAGFFTAAAKTLAAANLASGSYVSEEWQPIFIKPSEAFGAASA
jgi:hypothetical protein